GADRAVHLAHRGDELRRLAGAHREHPHALGLDPDRVEQALHEQHPVDGVEVALAVVALALEATGDHGAVGAAGQGLEQVQRRDAAGAGHEHEAHRRRQRRAGVGAGVGGRVGALATAESHDGTGSRRRVVRRALGRGARRLRRASGLSHRAHTRTSARISSSLKPPSCMAPDGQSAAQMPQPRQTFGSTSAWTSAPAVSVTAICGQAVSHTPQPMHTAVSDEATWAGVSTKPLESIEMARAAAALAWAIESGMFLGPWAGPHRNMPARWVSTGASLGWYSLTKPAAAVCRPATWAICFVPSDASRPAESTTRSKSSSFLTPV